MKDPRKIRYLNRTWKKWTVIFLVILSFLYIMNRNAPYQRNEGTVFGTTYLIIYENKKDLHTAIIREMQKVDAALSMFNDTSIVTRINRNEEVQPNDMFLQVFQRAQEVSAATEGAFDVTVAPLVNAWGFGFEKSKDMTQEKIDSLLLFVGYKKVTLKNKKIQKEDPRLRMDFSAIAKGYGVDAVATLLEKKGIDNYMVEIGGEVRVKGKSDKRKEDTDRMWRIGINRPVEDSSGMKHPLQGILRLTDRGMATSGNYRNYYYKDGVRYAHTINPHNGYPVQHSLLSATVLASDCMTADAYATSFMVMGLEKAIRIVNNHKELDACFLYSDSTGALKTWISQGIEKDLTLTPP